MFFSKILVCWSYIFIFSSHSKLYIACSYIEFFSNSTCITGIATRLRARRSGFRFPTGASYCSFFLFPNVQTGSSDHPVFYLKSTGVLSRGESGRGLKFTTLAHLTPRLRVTGAVPLRRLYTFIAYTDTTLFTCSVTDCLFPVCCFQRTYHRNTYLESVLRNYNATFRNRLCFRSQVFR
jgi:hypothetical protein